MPRAPRHCHRCDRTDQHGHPSPTSRASWNRAERERRAAAVQAWVAEHGWTCPGWQRPAHPSRDLTAAHRVAVVNGGTTSPLTVLCRSCNSRQGVQQSASDPRG